jgi:hypothetical protein
MNEIQGIGRLKILDGDSLVLIKLFEGRLGSMDLSCAMPPVDDLAHRPLGIERARRARDTGSPRGVGRATASLRKFPPSSAYDRLTPF